MFQHLLGLKISLDCIDGRGRSDNYRAHRKILSKKSKCFRYAGDLNENHDHLLHLQCQLIFITTIEIDFYLICFICRSDLCRIFTRVLFRIFLIARNIINMNEPSGNFKLQWRMSPANHYDSNYTDIVLSLSSYRQTLPLRALQNCQLRIFPRTMQCRYNAVYFLQNPLKIHPIVRPLGRGLGCILWVQTVIYFRHQSLQRCMLYHPIFYRVRYNGTRIYSFFVDLNITPLVYSCGY